MRRTEATIVGVVLAAFLGLPQGASAGDVSVRAWIGDGVRIGIESGDGHGVRHRRGVRHGDRHPRRGHRHRAERREREGGLDQIQTLETWPLGDFADPDRRKRDRRHKRRHRHSDRLFPPIIVYDDYYLGRDRYDDDDEEDEPEEPARAAAPPPPAPEPAPEAAAPEPPDARGPRFETARGRSAGASADYSVGQPLPAGVPHVVLDWQDYGLPRPPAGQSYARFAGAVLLIETDSRVVREVIWPTSG